MAETIQNDLFTVTEDGALQYRYDGETLRIRVSDGVASVENNEVTLLVSEGALLE